MAQGSTKFLQITAYVMIALIFIFVMGATRNCGRLNFADQERHSGGDTLDIAIIFGPGSYYFYEDTLGGINLDISKAFENALKIPVKVRPITEPEEGLTKLSKGTFDILASLPLDNNLRKNYKVSESIYLDRLVLLQKTDSATGIKKINSSLDLNGKKVYVVQGSSAVQRLKNLSEEIGGQIEIEEVPEISDELLSLKVADGSIDFAVVNEKVAREIAENYPTLNYDNSVSFTQFQVWIFNPEDSVISQKFNEWFDTYRTTDSYRMIINKY